MDVMDMTHGRKQEETVSRHRSHSTNHQEKMPRKRESKQEKKKLEYDDEDDAEIRQRMQRKWNLLSRRAMLQSLKYYAACRWFEVARASHLRKVLRRVTAARFSQVVSGCASNPCLV